MTIPSDQKLDAKGLACPMPIVRTKKAMKELGEGLVLEIEATDAGSTSDLKAWAQSAGHQYLGTKEEQGVLRHYVRKAASTEQAAAEEGRHEAVAELDALREKLNGGALLLDVREPAEYAFGHIPGAISIPLGELEQRRSELDAESELYVICRSGTRSDLAARLLTEAGFRRVFNVVPGMNGWTGELEAIDGKPVKEESR
ncbi:hypothetical protein HGI30_17645 [Paenibacillus albicereus]|uniref:Rhodanese domain-containing protein n=1 Tax=Paenibacillus albicereus TaxID=2726185 RepID=A0A6H2H1B9_9BACL|nr:sulfurtransferase TusA family protein [Paenibacillus albicereus]QJC53216.1 hypothetical protein HGI30_17645 [Paenibacillus albicereus]